MKGVLQYEKTIISYSIYGKGTPLVFIHGFGEDSSVWRKFAKPFRKKYQVICIDLPGCGKSGLIKDVSIDEMSEIVKTLLDMLGVRSCILIGHSMGGYVSLAFAEKYAGRMLGLTLFHSHPYADSEEKITGRKRSKKFLKEHSSKKYAGTLIPKLYAKGFLETNKKLIKRHKKLASSFSPESFRTLLTAMMQRPDRSGVLENAQFPVSFIIGRDDLAVPFEYSLNQTVLPEISDIHILDGVGHMGMFEARKTTRKIIRNFIGFCKGHQSK